MTRIVSAIALAVTAGAATATDWYVDMNAAPNGDGQGWGSAYQDIQTALTAAQSGHTIWVKDGTYTPIARMDNAAITIQSMNGPSATIIDGGGTNRCAMLGILSTHTAIVLSGFTLTNGNAAGSQGGGSCSGTLTNCVLTGNTANNGGGADGGILIDCVLTGNMAGNNGGGAHNSTLTGCVLTGNTASNDGGGSYFCTLTGCVLTGNTARNGGGSYGDTLTGCILSGNTASNRGGGARSSVLENCLVTGNTAAEGGGAYDSPVRNCTVAGNTATGSVGGGGTWGGQSYNNIIWPDSQ